MQNSIFNNQPACGGSNNPVSGSDRARLFPLPKPRPAKKLLQHYLETFRRGKWLFLSVLLTVFTAVALYTFIVPPAYKAYCLLLVGGTQGTADDNASGNADALNYGKIEGAAYGSRNLSNQTLILQQSLVLARRTAARLQLLKTAGGTPLSVLSSRGQALSTDEIAVRLQKDYITVALAGKDVDIIEISAISAHPAEASAIANLYAEEYVAFSREASRQHISASRTFLESQIEQRRTELSGFEDRIKQYRSREGAVALDQESQYTISQIAQLEAQLDESKIDQSMHEASLASLEDQLEKLHPALARRMASGLEADIGQTQKKIAELELITERIYIRNPLLRASAPGNPELADLTGQIDQLKQRVQSMSRQYVEEILAAGGIDPSSQKDGLGYITQINRKVVDERIAISGARAKIAALQQRLSEYGRKLEAIPKQVMELAQLERSRHSAESLYILLVSKLQEARIAEESEVGGAQVIRTAITPEKPVRPSRAGNLALGLILGILLGAGAAFARRRLDTRLYTPEDLSDRNLTLLAVLPDLSEAVRRDCGGAVDISFQNRRISSSLVSLFNPSSPESESFRRLHMALAAPSSLPSNRKIIMLTSAEEGVGKSTTVCNLGITMAKAGHRTLIVDADLFRPTVHRLLNLSPGPGIDRLIASASAMPHIDSLATGVTNLYALTAPLPVLHSGELFQSKAMHEIIRQLRGDFDMVLIDAPPVLIATDAAYLAPHCDAVVFVAVSGGTDAEALDQAHGEIAAVNAALAGVVLTRFNPSRIYGYKFTYGYMYKDHTQSIPRVSG
jgi:capsular exopolysaccharide synthesis family protein